MAQWLVLVRDDNTAPGIAARKQGFKSLTIPLIRPVGRNWELAGRVCSAWAMGREAKWRCRETLETEDARSAALTNSMKEKDLSVALGLTRDVLKKMRSAYNEGSDWVRIPSKKPKNLWEVQWTEQGLEKLRDTVGVVPEEEIVPPAMHKGRVLARFPNPRFIQVEFNGVKHVVLCRDNTKFTAGMPVWARWDGSRWVVVRHPRFPGRY